ncbi:MAG TPA: GIY-YIG nuclease family protein, partial [Cyclobacteriaceae bacterium]|nr:GIY-YIG nuclease family protein [Cyclobacteriaceae bacterium]
MKDQLKQHIPLLPDSPGVYRFYNAEDVLIYVGKAKSIRKRVSSYFNKIEGVNR